MGSLKILGVDPGKNGAFFLIDTNYVEGAPGAYKASAMPVIKQKTILTLKRDEKGKRIKKQPKTTPDWQGICDVFQQDFGNANIAYVERVSGGQSFGRAQSGSFNFGETYGFVCGLIMAYKIPLVRVPASVWKKALGLGDKTDKAASRVLATRILPSETIRYDRVKDDGVAEAGLIAYYGASQIKEN
jgi:crossover junction endodeoxyribonuclease RuvC